MENCIFCKIIRREIPSEIVYEDNDILAFKDISPVAPTHILVIPKKHIPSIDSLGTEDLELISKVFLILKKLAKDFHLDKDGYRIVNNCGELGGQTVHHLHFHLLGGRQMQWPPG